MRKNKFTFDNWARDPEVLDRMRSHTITVLRENLSHGSPLKLETERSLTKLTLGGLKYRLSPRSRVHDGRGLRRGASTDRRRAVRVAIKAPAAASSRDRGTFRASDVRRPSPLALATTRATVAETCAADVQRSLQDGIGSLLA
jgi:hypothetical protein